jgi:quinol monooxygenase YgiN
MAATVHVLARYAAKPGKEDELCSVLTALVPPTRREIGCYQYDLLVEAHDPGHFCFVERWDGVAALEQHLRTDHVEKALRQVEPLVAEPPDIVRYSLV